MNKIALITGATSGIGLELAKLFARDKINLLIVARNESHLKEIKQEVENQYHINVYYVAADLSISDSLQVINNYVENNNLQVDYLVNNAGFGDFGKFTERRIEKYREMISLNINALVELTHFYARKMQEQKNGKILNLCSLMSLQPFPEWTVYAATKAFVLSFTEALYKEFENTGITITALLPGATQTNFFNKADGTNSKATDIIMSPKEVAAAGYEAMMKGKRRVIAGSYNKFSGFMMQIIPTCRFKLNLAAKVTGRK